MEETVKEKSVTKAEVNSRIDSLQKLITQEFTVLEDLDKIDTVRFYNKASGVSSPPGYTYNHGFQFTKDLIQMAKQYSMNQIEKYKSELKKLVDSL